METCYSDSRRKPSAKSGVKNSQIIMKIIKADTIKQTEMKEKERKEYL